MKDHGSERDLSSPWTVGSRPKSAKYPIIERPASRVRIHGESLPKSQYHHAQECIFTRSPTLISEKSYPAPNDRPPTSRTYVSAQTSIQSSNAKTRRSHQRNEKGSISALSRMEPAFFEVSNDVPGLTIWRLEGKSKLTLIDENHHGFFHEASAYIVLKIEEDESNFLHYWIGEHCKKDHSKLIEDKAHELDRIIHNANVFSKETQNRESTCFRQHFTDGLIYIESKPKTVVSRACAYTKRMYKVTGRKYSRAMCVEPALEALDSMCACILDGFPRIYVWIGKSCNYSLRIKAIQLAKKIRDQQRHGISHIVIIDEKDEGMNGAFLKKLHNGCKSNSHKEQNQSRSTQSEKTVILHRVSGDRVMYDMPEASRRPLKQCYLVKRDSYLLDRGEENPLYVWVGCQANENEVLNAITRGKKFQEHKDYPENQTVCRIREDFEPPEFKNNFCDWREKELKHRQVTKKYSIGNIERALFSQRDNRTIAKLDDLWSEDILPDGENITEIWKVEGEKLEKLKWDQHGFVNNGQSYVVLYRAEEAGHIEHILYYWLGSKLRDDTQDTILDLVLSMNKALNNQCTIVRVLDQREPTHFMSLLHNNIVVYDSDLEGKKGGESQIFCVREFSANSTRVQQVPVSSSSLNSSASFVVTTPSECYLWYGKKSGGPEREYAKSLIGIVNPSRTYSFEIMTEGKETQAFWDILGPRHSYSKDFRQEVLVRRPPQLVHCNCLSSCISFENINSFAQEDLCEDEIFVLDVYDQICLWIGKDVPDEMRSKIPSIIKEYNAQDPSGRSEDTVNIWIVFQPFEPELFTKFFPFWYPNGHTGSKIYESARKVVRQENAKIHVDQEMVDRSYVGRPKYPYRELIKKELPEDVDEKHKEYHLSEKQFREATRFPRDEFYRLPIWKQEQILKSVHLFYSDTQTSPYLLRVMSPDMSVSK